LNVKEKVCGGASEGFAMTITPEDHEGGGWVQVWTLKDGKFEKTTDWFQAHRGLIKKHLVASAQN